MDLREKFIWIIFTILTISSLLVGKGIYQIQNMLDSGDHLMNARVSFTLHPEMPWADIPVFLREQIAQQHPGTKLDKKDLNEIIAWYNMLLKTYDGRDVVIAGKFDKEGRLKEESVK